MSGEDIVSLRLAYPFRPFTLVLTDGRRLPVNRPTALAISPDRRGLVYAPVTGGFRFLKASDVSAAELHDVTVAGDGRSGSR